MATTQKFSNSPLVVYTKLSPNNSGRRTMDIDRITPHCVVGQCSVEVLGDIFYPTARQASSNYGIGPDARIGMYCEEKNRSWCSSSGANDQRSITIECASDKTYPYALKSNVYDRLVDLCVDICKRYGKTKLIWINNKATALAYKPASNEMLLTVHQWFSNTECCGSWLYSRLGDLANKVTAKLATTAPSTKPSASTKPTTTANPTTTLPTTSNNIIKGTPEKIIWNFFRDKGLNDYAIAGIMGNLYAESGLIANNLQNAYEKRLNMNDDTYTESTDNGSYKNFVRDGAGYGLAQWTYWSRKEALLKYAKKVGKSIGDTTMQCEFLWNELNDSYYKKAMDVLKVAKSVREASDAFLLHFERPLNANETMKSKRAGYGDGFYKKNAKGDKAVTLPYKVKVNDDTGLNIRKGPGTNYGINGVIRDNGIYTITQESVGKGAKKWGKLKSGAGWISLDFCIKLS